MNRVPVASAVSSRQAEVAEFRRAFENEAMFRGWYDRSLPRVYAYLATADTAKVLSEMEASLAQHEMLAQTLPLVDRLYDPVRHTARFAEVVRKSGLEGRGLTGPMGGRPAK